ncbi:type II toxin-antitoxin system HicB family antitoxin [Thalassotalea ponticola]|uniref:type II toxin-antitoxin system HicB family antitoxin n=1 Tax=Thalassotalea ponticola TaxID=1523392 RepID=UPI0025B5D5A9|nr:type II toxin-antitoxin system HicB family antitoxin [Thalassotalea ponticola]MDN3651489.1 type II toxin-antitoxin system HicB family antitoxin [Thalassotalea ponticola]
MRFPIVLMFNPEKNDYKVVVVDMPGCECRATSIDQALDKVLAVIESHLSLLVEYGEDIPSATSFESHVSKMEYRGGVWAVVDIDLTPYLGKSHKINVTLPDLLIKKIDDTVASNPNYQTRSGFLATAAINELKKRPIN